MTDLEGLLEDTDRIHDTLLGVQLTCVFAIVGLLSFAVGWIKSVHANVEVPETTTALAAFAPEPVPGWTRTGLQIAAAVFVLATLANVYVLVAHDDVDVQAWLQERVGER